jgi:hypothetical protein
MVMNRFCPCLALLAAVAAFATAGQPAPKAGKGSAKDLKQVWEDLGSKDAAKAYRAIYTFATDPKQGVPFLKERLKPAVGPGPEVIDRLIADLDSKRAAEQDKAMKGLEKWLPQAVPALERALQGKPSPQLRKHIQGLLERAKKLTLSPEDLRAWRALEAVEQIGSPEARQLLEALAKGAPGAWLTEEAKAALKRLAKVKAPTP